MCSIFIYRLPPLRFRGLFAVINAVSPDLPEPIRLIVYILTADCVFFGLAMITYIDIANCRAFSPFFA